MTIIKFRDVLQDTAGNVIPEATVAVYETGTETPVTLYSDVDGNYPLAGNEVTSNELGEFTFYAVANIYDLVITATGFTTFTQTGVSGSVVDGNYAEAGPNTSITSLTGTHQIVVTDTGAPTGDTDALVESQGLESHWMYNLRRRDLGHDTRLGSDGVGIMSEHPIRTAPFGRTITLDDTPPAELGTEHQGALLRCGVTEAAEHILDFVSNATAGGITTMFIVQAVDYDVTLTVSAGGDELNGLTDDLVLAAGQAAMFTCDEDNQWRSFRIGGNATLATIPHADVGTTVGVPGRDLFYVPDYGGGSYWAPDANGDLLRLGANNGTQAIEFAIADLRTLTPLLDGGMYYATDWPSGKGSYWAKRGSVLDPLGTMLYVAKGSYQEFAADTTERVGMVALFPAGTLVAGYIIDVVGGMSKSSTVDSMNFRVRLGTDPTGLLPNAEIMQSSAITSNRGDGCWYRFEVINNTTLRRVGGQSISDLLATTTAAAGAAITVPDLSSNDLYLSGTVQISTAGGETPAFSGGTIAIIAP